MRRNGAVVVALAALALSTEAVAEPRSEVVDRTFDTAGAMFAYTEFELSGEPLAESLGLDLDVLDPNQVDAPTPFDYAAGIESYEYSEEAMYALDYQSKLGIHLVNGPANAARGGSRQALGKRLLELAGAVKFGADELPLNLYPISLPYRSGTPQFAAAVDRKPVRQEKLELVGADKVKRALDVAVPAYFRDFATLGWQTPAATEVSPAGIGGSLLKEVLWSQDFLGGMHTIEGDEEVEAASAKMDQDGKHALGVSSIDGVNGMLLTEIAWDKLWIVQSQLGFDGTKLGAKFGFDYDPAKQPIWLPHGIRVKQTQKNEANAIESLSVSDRSSQLRDTWLLLWASSELYAFSDARTAHAEQNPAFLAVFDGAPFPAAPKQNLDGDAKNDSVGTDPFSLAANVSNLLFKNLSELHFDAKAGTFVDRWETTRGKEVTAYDAAYAIGALSVFQRAQDALPVGYASGTAGDGLKSAQGKRALELIRAQGKFIADKMIGPKGLVADSYEIGVGPKGGTSLGTQFAAIRGLAAAFVATGDASFKAAARKIFLAVEKEQLDPALGIYSEAPGKPTEHTPWTAGAVSGGLRALLLHLRAEEGEKAPLLTPDHLTGRYTAWFKKVVNGQGMGAGMQLAEWIGDSGENVLATPPKDVAAGADTDRDGVKQVTAAGGPHGTAMVLAGRLRVTPPAAAPAKKP